MWYLFILAFPSTTSTLFRFVVWLALWSAGLPDLMMRGRRDRGGRRIPFAKVPLVNAISKTTTTMRGVTGEINMEKKKLSGFPNFGPIASYYFANWASCFYFFRGGGGGGVPLPLSWSGKGACFRVLRWSCFVCFPRFRRMSMIVAR